MSQKKGVLAATWTPDGQFIYTVNDGNSINLWTRDARGESTKQLTFDTNKNFRPVMSPDGRFIFFVSSRAGETNLWRMEADGTDPIRLTTGQYEDMPSVSPDGQWIIYRTGNSIRKIPVGGGTSVNRAISVGFPGEPGVSPEGTAVMLRRSSTLGNAAAATVYLRPACT